MADEFLYELNSLFSRVGSADTNSFFFGKDSEGSS